MEIVVALLVFTVSMLALAAAASIIARAMRVNAVREAAARVAISRLERLRSECSGAQSGTETIGPVLSRWTVTAAGASRVRVMESVSYATQGDMRTDVYSAAFLCGLMPRP